MNPKQIQDILDYLNEYLCCMDTILYKHGNRQEDEDKLRDFIGILEAQRGYDLFGIQTSLQLRWCDGEKNIEESDLPGILEEANMLLFERGIEPKNHGYTLNASLENGCLILFLSE